METEKQPLIQLSRLTYGYPGRTPVLNHLDFTLFEGDRIGLLGPNGSGKTTLFHLIMGLLTPQAGDIRLFGRQMQSEKDFQTIYRQIGLLFQDADDQLFCPTVLEDVAFGPLNLNKSKTEAIAIARATLASLGLSGFENRITHQLSGGEKRLIALAAVLAMAPRVLLLDEPSTGLDNRTRDRLCRVLNDLDQSYILISHESEFINATTNTLCLLEKGHIHPVEVYHQHPHTHPHTHDDHHH